MKKKITKKPASQEQKAGLSILRKLGLYRPKKPRSAPTRHGLSLLDKFADVISGASKVLKVDKVTAREYRDDAAKPGTVRARGARLVVPVQPGEKAVYSKSKREVEVIRTLETGQRYVRTPFPKKPRSYDDVSKQIGPRDRIAVAMYRGKRRPRDWRYFTLQDFYTEFVGGYSSAASEAARSKALAWALENAQISRYEEKGEARRERERARRRADSAIKSGKPSLRVIEGGKQ